MRLNSFDFLSSSPQNFIFQRRINRTNFGGFLSFIYLLIFLTITGFYLISYFNEDDYSIQYLYKKLILNSEEKSKLYNDSRYNPAFNFYFNFSFNDKGNISERYQIRLYDRPSTRLYTSKLYKGLIPYIDIYVLFDCLYAEMDECDISIYDYRRKNLHLNI